MVQGKKQKGKSSSRARETSMTEEPNTARAGEADEPSRSQDRRDPIPVEGNYSGDEEISYQKLSKPFTDRQDKQIAAFFGEHPCFYDKTHPDYKNEKKRDALIKQFAQSMFASGKCVFSFKYILHTIVFLLVMKRVMK